jgi:hypothetical protein
MTPRDLLHRKAAKWLEQSAKDLTAAKALVDEEASRLVFHSQQAAEKAVKGFLTFCQIAFGRPTILRTWVRSAPRQTRRWNQCFARLRA